jgi:SAM-dependent methyltransferase
MSDPVEHTRERWNELAAAGVQYSRPWLDLNRANARRRVDPFGLFGDVENKEILCLAAGGGPQSAAFALLGARVTVLDLSDEMLKRDEEAAEYYGISVTTIQGDACDLSALPASGFDGVFQAHSLSFIRDLDRLFAGVRRVLKNHGTYHLSAWNPLAYGADERWTGEGYLLKGGYEEGMESVCGDGYWDITDANGNHRRVAGPREYRHTLSGLINGLISHGFGLLRIHEEPTGSSAAEPGSWDHFCSVAPPWLHAWVRKCGNRRKP